MKWDVCSEKVVHVFEKRSSDGTWTESHRMDLHKYSVNQVAFSSCGTKLLSCSMDGVLIHWDIQVFIT